MDTSNQDRTIAQNIQSVDKSTESIQAPRKSKWVLVGSAIIISIACIDPGNLQGLSPFKKYFSNSQGTSTFLAKCTTKPFGLSLYLISSCIFSRKCLSQWGPFRELIWATSFDSITPKAPPFSSGFLLNSPSSQQTSKRFSAPPSP